MYMHDEIVFFPLASIVISPPRRVGRHLVFALVVCPSVTKSCPLCNSKTVRDILMKLYTNVKQHETTCRVQEP